MSGAGPHLNLNVDSSDVARAAIDLDALEAAALSAGYAVESLADHQRTLAYASQLQTNEIENGVAAILREAMAHDTATQQIQEHTQAMHGLRFGVANIAAQMQDVVVTSAMSMNVFTIGLQQGTQAAAALAMAGGTVSSTMNLMREALMSVLSPLSLLTIGVVVVAAAMIQWGMATFKWGETSAQALERHMKALDKAVAGYKEAETIITEFEERAGRLSVPMLELKLGKSLEDANKEIDKFEGRARSLGEALTNPVRAAMDPTAKMIGQLLLDYANVEITGGQLLEQLTKIKNSDLGPLGFTWQAFLDDMINSVQTATQFEGILVDITHALAAAGTQIAPYGLKIGLESQIEGDKLAKAHQIEMDAIYAKSPAQLADIAMRREKLKLVDEEISESLRQQKIDEAGQIAYTEASYSISEANRQRLRAAQENVDASNLELESIGKSIAETTRLKFVREELAAAEEEAAQNGVSVSRDYIRQIQEIGKEYGDLAQQIAEQGAISDLLFARSQMGRSDIEQNVASTLRSIYGDDFASQMDGFVAHQVRINEVLSSFDDIGRDLTQNMLVGFAEAWQKAFLDSAADTNVLRMKYATDLLSEAQQNGASVTEAQRLEIVALSLAMAESEAQTETWGRVWDSAWKAAGDITISTFDKIANKALSMAADGIWDMIFGAVSGALGGSVGGAGATGGILGAGLWGSAIFGGHANGVKSAPAGLAWVGERGPELMNFNGGEKVTNNSDSMSMMNRGGTTENHYHIDARGAELGVEDRIANAIDSWERNRAPSVIGSYLENDRRVG